MGHLLTPPSLMYPDISSSSTMSPWGVVFHYP